MLKWLDLALAMVGLALSRWGGCSCGESANWATRISCRACGNIGPTKQRVTWASNDRAPQQVRPGALVPAGRKASGITGNDGAQAKLARQVELLRNENEELRRKTRGEGQR